jgi:ABC-type bacteriocin/lantibiotic exporter with double-glycine peptidase domain
LLQRFVSLRFDNTTTDDTDSAARKMSVALSAARLALFNRSVPDNIALADPAMSIERNTRKKMCTRP